MAFVVIGVLLVVLRWAEIGPVAAWSWWWVVSPFGLALAWWAIADATGFTQTQAMQKYEDRRAQRRRAQMEAMGMQAPPPGARPRRSSAKPADGSKLP